MTTSSAIVSKGDDPVLNEAARWFVLFQQSDLKYKTIVAWEQWMSESRAHRAAFAGLQSVPEIVPPMPSSIHPDTFAPINSEPFEYED